QRKDVEQLARYGRPGNEMPERCDERPNERGRHADYGPPGVHGDENALGYLTKRQLGGTTEWKDLLMRGRIADRVRDDLGDIVDRDRLKPCAAIVRKRQYKWSEAHQTSEHVDELVLASEDDGRAEHRPFEVARRDEVLRNALASKESVRRLAVGAVLRHVHEAAYPGIRGGFDHGARCVRIGRFVGIAIVLDSDGGEVNDRCGAVHRRREVRRVPNVTDSDFHWKMGESLGRFGGASNKGANLPAFSGESLAGVTADEAGSSGDNDAPSESRRDWFQRKRLFRDRTASA